MEKLSKSMGIKHFLCSIETGCKEGCSFAYNTTAWLSACSVAFSCSCKAWTRRVSRTCFQSVYSRFILPTSPFQHKIPVRYVHFIIGASLEFSFWRILCLQYLRVVSNQGDPARMAISFAETSLSSFTLRPSGWCPWRSLFSRPVVPINL